MPMFAAVWYFLGLAACLLMALCCFTRGNRAGRRVEVDLGDLRVASLCLVSAGSKPTWHAIRALWMRWYLQCQETAIRKQKALYSWSRTLSLCAVLCLIGVLLEAELAREYPYLRSWPVSRTPARRRPARNRSRKSEWVIPLRLSTPFADAETIKLLIGVSAASDILKVVRLFGDGENHGGNIMKTLLFVDDDPGFRELCRRVFEEEGYCVLLAEDGPAALETVAAQTPTWPSSTCGCPG